jgi:hypothetical protein
MMENVMNEFKSWEEMSDLEQAQCQFWDMYKDAYGVRPRGIDTSTWTLDDFTSEFASLSLVIEREEVQRKINEAEASVRFENQITSLVQSGARNRQAAIAWIHEAEGTQGDDEYLCFTLGLPYGYFRKVA